MDQFPPSSWLYHEGRYELFRKFAEIFTAQGANHRCQWHRWQREKIFNQKSFHYFFWTPLGSRVSIQINFFLQVHLSGQQSDIVPIVCHQCKWHRWQPPVSLIPVVICHRYQQHQRNRWQNFLPVLLIQMVHHDLQISTWIFEKIRNDTGVIFRGLEEDDSWKKSEARNLVTLSLWGRKNKDYLSLSPLRLSLGKGNGKKPRGLVVDLAGRGGGVR